MNGTVRNGQVTQEIHCLIDKLCQQAHLLFVGLLAQLDVVHSITEVSKFLEQINVMIVVYLDVQRQEDELTQR